MALCHTPWHTAAHPGPICLKKTPYTPDQKESRALYMQASHTTRTEQLLGLLITYWCRSRKSWHGHFHRAEYCQAWYLYVWLTLNGSVLPLEESIWIRASPHPLSELSSFSRNGANLLHWRTQAPWTDGDRSRTLLAILSHFDGPSLTAVSPLVLPSLAGLAWAQISQSFLTLPACLWSCEMPSKLSQRLPFR